MNTKLDNFIEERWAELAHEFCIAYYGAEFWDFCKIKMDEEDEIARVLQMDKENEM